jgi:hypothetical protein
VSPADGPAVLLVSISYVRGQSPAPLTDQAHLRHDGFGDCARVDVVAPHFDFALQLVHPFRACGIRLKIGRDAAERDQQGVSLNARSMTRVLTQWEI